MTREQWLPIASLHLPLLGNAGTAPLLACRGFISDGQPSWFITIAGIWFLIPKEEFRHAGSGKSPSWRLRGKPGAGHNFSVLNGVGQISNCLIVKKGKTQGRNCAASESLFSVSAQQTRPTLHSPCPIEHWRWDAFKNKNPRRTMQSWILVWMLQICLIETRAGVQTCCWIIASTLWSRAWKPFDGVIVITWHKYSFKESEQSKWHFSC